ncbi:aminoglycoside phosphotransferase family protein [Rhizobium lusitanum]|uniref:Thiamine kinase-like enzyme n=1 Tax=Rhizobium lusitanum TaxID=293958 RepID=A0A7X0M9P2_9HYPH|nr:aminoglycoside phosphotransferase family protein [Rhizobium lusitanum]MBB6482902.1 thiamine kinase-like enzyme [Rhizobium lusitanum]
MQTSHDQGPLRDGDTVLRQACPWTPNIHALLAALPEHGFTAAPAPISFDAVWERVSYLPGATGDLDSSREMRTEKALRSAASLLRHYHDCSALLLPCLERELVWQLSSREPAEIICHGDFAPYNVLLNDGEVTGIIDFEAAHPGPRSWDIAYAIYRWAPLSSDVEVEGLGRLDDQIRRARMFVDAYGMSIDARHLIPETIVARLEALLAFMEHEASRGVERYRRNLQDGHDRIYRHDIAYVLKWSLEITAGLVD